MLCVTQTCYTTGMEEMPKIQYLIRRRQTWYVRLRIPVDLLELYKPKKEFLRSLQTRDYKEALKRLSPAKAEIEAEFEARRKQLSAQNDQSDILAAYSDHELIQLTRKWFSDMRAAEDVRRIKGQGRWTEERKREYHIELQQEESAARDEVLGLSEREEHMGMTLAGKFLKAEGISYQPSSENMDKLAYFFSKAIHELAQASLKEFEGKLPLGGSISAIGPYSSGFTPTKVVTMGALFDEYLADPSRKRQASTLKNYTIIRRAVDEVIGSNTPVHKVTRRDCRALQEFLLLLPANAVKKTQANTLKEAIKIAETQNLPRSADTTVNMHLQKLNAVMSYAIREGYINYHPAQGMYVQEIMKSNARRLPFDADQVNKIFNAPLGDLQTAIWLTIQLCRSDKIRIAEQTYTQAERASNYHGHRLRLAGESDEHLYGIVADPHGDLVERTMALWLLAGTKRFSSDYMPMRLGSLTHAVSAVEALDTPHDFTKACMSVISRSPWPLSLITPLCWQAVQAQPKPLYVWLDPIPVADDYRTMPLYACDMFTRIGKACIREFQKTIRPLKHYSTEQIGLGVFYVEGGRLDKVLTSEWLEGFRQSAELADIENTGMILPEYLGFKELIAENMPTLNTIRRSHLKTYLRGA